jgi:hypothetical protein
MARPQVDKLGDHYFRTLDAASARAQDLALAVRKRDLRVISNLPTLWKDKYKSK